MKTLFALILFSLPQFAAAEGNACAFGETTGDLKEEFESNRRGKQWYEGEKLTFHSEQRLQGLNQVEKEMIQLATGAGGTLEETLVDFVSSDGYITYFAHNSNGREFAIVASYPGDNEYGAIVEVNAPRRGSREGMKVLGIAASIGDGELAGCKVF